MQRVQADGGNTVQECSETAFEPKEEIQMCWM
jgi:hypothetical protein